MKPFHARFSRFLRLLIVPGLGAALFLGGASTAKAQNSTPIDISVGPDNRTRILWEDSDNALSIWSVNSSGFVWKTK